MLKFYIVIKDKVFEIPFVSDVRAVHINFVMKVIESFYTYKFDTSVELKSFVNRSTEIDSLTRQVSMN